MTKTLDDFFNEAPPVEVSYSRGGARRNSGPKKGHRSATDETPVEQLTDYQRLERAKADKEEQQARSAKVKADLDEGSVVYVAEVEAASAMAFAACSSSLDSIPDLLERDGIDPDVCVKVGDVINAAKQQLMKDLEKTYVVAKVETDDFFNED